MQAGTVSRLRFCKRSWGFKIYFGWNIVFSEVIHLFREVRCVRHKLLFRPVQQNQKSFVSLDVRLRFDGIPALDLWNLIVAVLGNTNQSHTEQDDQSKNKREVRSPPYTIDKRKIWIMLILFPQTSNLLIKKLCCMCLKTTKQWSRWS